MTQENQKDIWRETLAYLEASLEVVEARDKYTQDGAVEWQKAGIRVKGPIAHRAIEYCLKQLGGGVKRSHSWCHFFRLLDVELQDYLRNVFEDAKEFYGINWLLSYQSENVDNIAPASRDSFRCFASVEEFFAVVGSGKFYEMYRYDGLVPAELKPALSLDDKRHYCLLSLWLYAELLRALANWVLRRCVFESEDKLDGVAARINVAIERAVGASLAYAPGTQRECEVEAFIGWVKREKLTGMEWLQRLLLGECMSDFTTELREALVVKLASSLDCGVRRYVDTLKRRSGKYSAPDSIIYPVTYTMFGPAWKVEAPSGEILGWVDYRMGVWYGVALRPGTLRGWVCHDLDDALGYVSLHSYTVDVIKAGEKFTIRVLGEPEEKYTYADGTEGHSIRQSTREGEFEYPTQCEVKFTLWDAVDPLLREGDAVYVEFTSDNWLNYGWATVSSVELNSVSFDMDGCGFTTKFCRREI